jgi:hypothetical protein
MADGELLETSGLLGRKRDTLVLHGEHPPQCLLERGDVMIRFALFRNTMLSFAFLLYLITRGSDYPNIAIASGLLQDREKDARRIEYDNRPSSLQFCMVSSSYRVIK